MQKPLLKPILILPILLLLIVFSCKDKEEFSYSPEGIFEKISRQDIFLRANSLSRNEIVGTDLDGFALKIYDVILYRTNTGRYGKMKILNFEKETRKLTIKAITYDSDGTVYNKTEALEIGGSRSCNLDFMSADVLESDFSWYQTDPANTLFRPAGSAAFVLY